MHVVLHPVAFKLVQVAISLMLAWAVVVLVGLIVVLVDPTETVLRWYGRQLRWATIGFFLASTAFLSLYGVLHVIAALLPPRL
jgi:cellulose synthase/poly-beta-1,6-N-acetylglucosamine synthase-like glycosyltransferase